MEFKAPIIPSFKSILCTLFPENSSLFYNILCTQGNLCNFTCAAYSLKRITSSKYTQKFPLKSFTYE